MAEDAYFLRKIADEYFGEKKDDCHELLNLASDEIIKRRFEIEQLRALARSAIDGWRKGNDVAGPINRLRKYLDERLENKSHG